MQITPSETMVILEMNAHWPYDEFSKRGRFDTAKAITDKFSHKIAEIETVIAMQSLFGVMSFPCKDFKPETGAIK